MLFQQTMELPSEQPHQRILKVQKLIQIHSEFVTVRAHPTTSRAKCVLEEDEEQCVRVRRWRHAECAACAGCNSSTSLDATCR
jgi:hypothetical protein